MAKDEKPFSQKLHKKADGLGRKHLLDILLTKYEKDKIEFNEKEDTGENGYWDARVQVDDEKYIYFEAEVKFADAWGWGLNQRNPKVPFLYKDIRVPRRKQKNKAAWFFVFSESGQYGCCISRKNIINGEVHKINTCYHNADPLLVFPVEQEGVVFYWKENDVWKTMKEIK